MSYRDTSMDALIEQIIRIGAERDEAIARRDALEADSYPLYARIAALETKYEPKPKTYWKQIQVDVDGNPVQQSSEV